MSPRASGFLRGLSAWQEAGVEYVIVGVGGINFYARTPASAFATLDLDALLEPSVPNLHNALESLARVGYSFEAGGEPFVDRDDEEILGRVLGNRASLSALHEEGGQIDLMLAIAGFSYAQLAVDATTFRVGGVDVQVGRLEKLLHSKEVSGRAKDIDFLRAFEARGPDAGDESEDP